MSSNDKSTIVIRPYSPADSNSLYHHLQNVFRLENPFNALNFYEEECAQFCRRMINEAEESGVSYVAIDKQLSADHPAIIGCVLAGIEYWDDPNWKEPALELNEKQKILKNFYVQLLNGGQPEEISNQRLLNLHIFSVDPAYQRQKLCKRMLDLCMHDAATMKKCTAAVVYVTSYKSQALARNANFLLIKELHFDEFNKTQPDDGRIIMKDPKNVKAQLFWKPLINCTDKD